MQTIRDIMTTDVVTATGDASVGEIAGLMCSRGISGVPVVEGERVVGMVTELDLVARNARFKLPAFITLLNATIYLETPGHVRKRLQHMLGTTAREVMSPVATISADGTLEELAELMVERRVNPIPVVENGRLVGIVSRADVVELMAQKELSSEPA